MTTIPPASDFEIVTLTGRRFVRHKRSGSLVQSLLPRHSVIPDPTILAWAAIGWAQRRDTQVKRFE